MVVASQSVNPFVPLLKKGEEGQVSICALQGTSSITNE